jgi:hypothetical protein
MDGSTAYWYGVASPGEIARLTGKEILQAIISGRLPHPPISKTMTFWLVEIGEGFAAFEGEPGDHLLNPMGTAHGGWAMTLIDSATGCAGYSLIPAGAGFRRLRPRSISRDRSPAIPGASGPKRMSYRRPARSSRPKPG